jgi:uncharacterized protein (TIGR02594 family)
MYSKRKTLTATAIVVAAVMVAASQSPAQARRYKHVAVQKHAVTYHAGYRHAGKRSRVSQRRVVATAPVYPFGGGGMFSQWSQPSQAHEGRRAQRFTKRAAAPQASRPAAFAGMGGFGSSGLVAQARQYVGTNPTGMGALWCARFMNLVLEKSGRRGTGSNMANSFANYGTRVAGPQVGAIAVMSRGKRGGHVGIVSGIDTAGNPIVISGNYNRRVAETVIPRGRIYAYVMP